jgi:predicted nucleic acid-binding Zn ribbon protein
VSRDPVPIGDSLNSVVRSLRNDAADSATTGQTPGQPTSQPASQMGNVFGRWAEAVGAAVAAHVKPVKLDGTKLIVEVDDPAWATQLRFLEATMKQRLLEVAGASVETIEARVRRF